MTQEDSERHGKHVAEEGATEIAFERVEGGTSQKGGRGPALRRTGNKEKANIKAAECTRGKEGEGQAMQGRRKEQGMGFGERTLEKQDVARR